jgi:hypothetical protein
MDLIKESKVIPQLVNPNNFKIKKIKPIDPAISFKKNSRNLNTILLVGFIIFFSIFLLGCKFGLFRSDDQFQPEGIAYTLSV